MKRLRTILQCDYFYYALFFLIIIFTIFRINMFHSIQLNDSDNYLVFVDDFKIDGDYLKIEGKISNVTVIATYYISSFEEQQYLIKNIKYGSLLEIKGKVVVQSNSTIPNGFNYKDYLEKSGINNSILIENIKVISQSNNIFYVVKNKAYERISLFKNPNYMYAFILGNTNYISSDINDMYVENGITHLFSLSGLHVGIFALIIMKLLKIFRIKEFKRICIVFAFLLVFAFITGYSPSIIRATILFFLVALNKYLKFNVNTENILIVTFAVSLLLKPNDIYNVGFQLSYIVTYFLIVSNFLFKSKNAIKVSFLIGVISCISSLPIIINLNGEINLFSIFNNIIFVPFVSYIIFPLALFTYMFPFMQNIFYFFVEIMEHLSIFLNDFKLIIVVKNITFICVVIYYIFLFLLFKTKKLKFLVLDFLLILIIKFSTVLDKNTYFYFLDVGQGDSMFILTENKKSIIIDTGGKIDYEKEEWAVRRTNYSICEDTLIPFYKSLGVKKIDYMFVTHGDYDHMGEAINLVENFKVEKVIFNCGEYNELEKDLIKVLDKKKTPYYSCIKELNIDNNKLYFLNNNDYGNENDNSSVIYTELNNYKFLFMGDAGVEVEEDLIEKYNLQDIDILKVGHHGSKTSSGKEFIDETNPKYSIISVGKNNRYGHPNDSVLENLEDSKIYRTDQDGSIMFKIKNNKLDIETCAP